MTTMQRPRPAADPYLRIRGVDGFDGQVGGRVRSHVRGHNARDGIVQPPLRSEPGRVMVLLDGDAEPVSIEPRLVRALHPPHLSRIDELELVPICFLGTLIPIEGGEGRCEGLPQDMIARDGRGLIIWREPDRSYDFAGWSPWRGHLGGMFGGRRTSIHSALNWYQRALDIEAGHAANFGGC